MREQDLSVVVRTLEEEFNIYREVGGDSLPLHSHDGFNGLQPNGREGKNEPLRVTPPTRTESIQFTQCHSQLHRVAPPNYSKSL